MESINIIGDKTPESTGKKAPFEIVIRTFAAEYLAHGGPEEVVVPCDGYWLAATESDGQHHIARGEMNMARLAAGVLGAVGPEALLAGVALLRLRERAKDV
jgi:hypothetical protein